MFYCNWKCDTMRMPKMVPFLSQVVGGSGSRDVSTVSKKMAKVNEDLVRERKKCTFDVNELIHLIDGGENITKERKEVEEMVLAVKELRDEVPEEYLSHKDRYENAIRKAFKLYEKLKEYALAKLNMDDFRPSTVYNIQYGIIKDVSPLLLHMGMFVPTIIGQASPEQQGEWLMKALNMEYIGTYAQTELGHGTFLRGLETTATYDADTEEFILNSPTLTSYKWWPGGLGHTTNHCIVVAQTYTQGQFRGVHAFFVKIRDLETHMPLSGIKVGEIGPKLGFQTANNGFLGFENHRIPRNCMLMKNAQVLKDGTYIKAKNDKLTYGTMVFVRVNIVNDMAYALGRAATIAVRYSAVRHQSKPKENEPEPQIIDYLTQQHKLFICIATSHADRLVGKWLWNRYVACSKGLNKGNMDLLPEMHALSCCIKAVSTKDAARCVEECRLACGGHGYMLSSNLPILYGTTTAAVTYEGEYTVLQLQTARYLVKSWKQVIESKPVTETVEYLAHFFNNNSHRWENTPEGIIKGFQAVAAGKTKAAFETIQKYEKQGMDYEDAWNMASVQLVNASEAHSRSTICSTFWREALALEVSPKLLVVLKQLAELYLVYWALEKTGDLLLYSTISKDDIAQLQQRYEQLLLLIRPNAVGLVDGFDIRDEILNSTLGAYDGRVYERLMEEALKSPLNQQPVNDSFHKYIKPFNKAKI